MVLTKATRGPITNLFNSINVAQVGMQLDRSIQYLCNEVLLDGSQSYFHSEIEHPASKKY